MAKQKKKVNQGPHIKNAHLIGKGGGQVKPIDGSFVKGIAKRPPPVAKPGIKKHISIQPAKKPANIPSREKTPGRSMQASKPALAKVPQPAKAPSRPKNGKTSPKTPSKAALAKAVSRTKRITKPKESTPAKTKSTPKKGR